MSANTTPIYTKEPFNWRIQLIDQLSPRKLTTETPVLLGTAGDYGGLVWGISIQPLGDNVATTVRFYSKVAVDTDYQLLFEETLPETSTTTESAKIPVINITLPSIGVQPNATGLHLESGESLFASLGVEVATGFNVFVRGGNY